MRYSDGAINHTESDLHSNGFGTAWGHTRSYSNQLNTNTGGRQGNSWLVPDWQYLVFLTEDGNDKISVVRGSNNSLWFTETGGAWVGEFEIQATLTEDAGSNSLILYTPDGYTYHYNNNDPIHGNLRGRLTKVISPGGDIANLNYDEPKGCITQYEQSSSGKTVTYNYEYLVGINGNMLGSVTLQVDGTNVRKATYSY